MSKGDIKQILREAQHRWLRPAEICEILRDYKKFHISPEPPHKPVSGSVFLFDRKVLRYFRKDGHNWRKKKDGKTVREAHEKLKVGSIDMLHCYYAHGEDNENFQRRSYWMLEQDLMHIVFVHYLEVKGNKTNTSYARNNESSVSNSEDDSSSSSCFHGNYEKIVSANATSSSPISTLTSAYETNEPEDILHVSSRFDSYPELPLTDDRHPTRSSPCDSLPCPGNRNVAAMNYAALGHRYENSDGGSVLSGAQTKIDLASWEDVFGHCTSGEIAYKQESGCSLPVQANWQENPIEQSNFQMLDSHSDIGNLMKPHAENDVSPVGTENYSFLLKKPLISGLRTEESLKKVDSFSRWVAKELGEADELHMESNNGISWNIMGAEDYSSMPAELQEDLDALSPSLSQDQLFSIIDFSPNWAYSNLETKVLISGTFLKSEQELANCRWSIMFGELEVPAEVLEDGLLCCHAPRHKPGSVPFYITCSNRLACSEVREFEYRFGPQKIVAEDVSEGTSEIQFRLRFEKLMSLNLVCNTYILENDTEKQNIVNRIFSWMERENHQEAKATSENYTSQTNVAGELFLEKQLKEKFYSWLLHKVTEDCKGPNVFDEGGQGPLHLAAALGYNWALLPIIVSKVSIDFRDVNGWTALHWAAFCGREGTVASLISLGAAPGALTDPSAEHPLGRTPADLASASGHKGISGFLAETSLTKHLSSLTVNDPQDYGTSEVKAIHAVSERVAIPKTEQDVPDALSLKDSLAAVCNATQAAARIHQIFRVQSLQRKQFDEQSYDELVTPEEHAISLVAAKTSRLGQNDGTNNAAALRIQKKFRGWKKRKEFLLIRQKIVKIQAHVRGHQVRKKYKPIVWSVGILEKVILRWRRKGAGLRGFQRDGILKGPSMQGTLQQEDDYDFLKEGRKQTEERLQKALARVKSMTQYPEARAQYRRLLTAAEGLRETTQDASGTIENNLEDAIYPEDELIDVETLLDDDTFMSIAFQ